jgi:hypothetical protein
MLDYFLVATEDDENEPALPPSELDLDDPNSDSSDDELDELEDDTDKTDSADES